MDYIVHDVLAGELVPVLLGISQEVSETAHRMYRQYGVISHVFCNNLPLPLRLSLCMKYHVIHHTQNQQLMIRALLDFSSQIEKADVIPYLIPCSEHYNNLVWEHHNVLERHFVIADRRLLQNLWLDDNRIGAEGGRTHEIR